VAAAEGEAEHGEQQTGRDAGPGQRALPNSGAGQRGHVAGADEADDRRAGDDARQEPPPGHRRGPPAKAGGGVPGCAGRARHRLAQRREHRGEDGRQAEQRHPGDDRGRPGLLGGQARQEQESRAEQGADVQRAGARDRQREGLCR
jgi:hypothetical protein